MTAVGKLGDEIGLSAVEAAYGIHKVVTESMAAAARIHLVEKGKDPRAYAMVGFGGAGPAHAAGVARILGIREVIIPPASGAASCLGFLVAPLSFERVRSLSGAHRARASTRRRSTRSWASSRPKAARCSPRPASRARRSTVERTADMRLVGQMHEINVPLPAGTIGEASLGAIRTAFADVYTKRYTSLYGEAAIEAISFHVRVLGPAPELSLNQARRAAGAAETQRRAPGLVRRRLRRSRRSTTAMRSCPATGSKARRSSRSARRPPSCRPATACRSTPISTCGLRSASRRRRRRWSRRARRSPTRWRGSKPIRSRSKSCGAASSPWSTRCGSR